MESCTEFIVEIKKITISRYWDDRIQNFFTESDREFESYEFGFMKNVYKFLLDHPKEKYTLYFFSNKFSLKREDRKLLEEFFNFLVKSCPKMRIRKLKENYYYDRNIITIHKR